MQFPAKSRSSLVAHPNKSVETQFAQKLADNEPSMRTRALKKLRRWLATHKDGEHEHEFLRVWKGLFYCFWMADKMLAQEELAQSISELVHAFKSFDASMSFARCGFVSLGREWLGIDRIRLDKFMLLARRLVRETLVLVKNEKWSLKKSARVANNVFGEAVINANQGIVDMKTSLAFQMHVVDVFLEELAKVGGKEGIGQDVILVFLKPFVKQLSRAKCDNRLRENIEERVFRHLMRQSDLGIAHEELMARGKMHMDADMLENGDDDEEDDEDLLEFDDNGPKDPRAGQVDIVIPQLELNYKDLAEQLIAHGSRHKVPAGTRKRVFELAKQFQVLEDGKYPLMVEDDEESDNMDDEERALQLVEWETNKLEKAQDGLANSLREERQQYLKDLKSKKRRNDENGGEELNTEEATEQDIIGPVVKQRKKKRKVETKVEVEEEIHFQTHGSQDSACKEFNIGEPSEDDLVEPVVKKKKSKVETKIVEIGTSSPTHEGLDYSIVTFAEEETVDNDDDVVEIVVNKKEAEIVSKNDTEIFADDTEVKVVEIVEIKSDEAAEKEAQNLEIKELNVKEAIGKKLTKRGKKNKKRKQELNSIQIEREEVTVIDDETENGSETMHETDQKHETLNTQSETIDFHEDELSISEVDTSTTEIEHMGQRKKVVKKKKKKTIKNGKKANESLNTSNTDNDETMITPKTSVPRQKSLSGKKRINFSMVRNRYQSVAEHSASVESSPNIPFDSEKQPKQGVLKRKEDLSNLSKKERMAMFGKKALMRNTRINAKSRVVKRMWASDFF